MITYLARNIFSRKHNNYDWSCCVAEESIMEWHRIKRVYILSTQACGIASSCSSSRFASSATRHCASRSLWFITPSCNRISPSFGRFRHRLVAILVAAALPIFAPSLLSSIFNFCLRIIPRPYPFRAIFQPTRDSPARQRPNIITAVTSKFSVSSTYRSMFSYNMRTVGYHSGNSI
jgi:hypothetical protein